MLRGARAIVQPTMMAMGTRECPMTSTMHVDGYRMSGDCRLSWRIHTSLVRSL
jgi:hypothetical protein